MFLRIELRSKLILQLETDYFSSYSFQKCSIRSSGITVFTETSRTAILHEEVLQDSSAPILQGYPYITHIQPTCAHYTTSREFSIQNPILHAEDKELFQYYYWCESRIQKRNSTHRRQGDLLEYIRVFQRHSRHSSLSRHSRHSSLSSLSRHSSCFRHSRDIPDIPVIHDLPAFPGNSTILQSSKYPQGIQPITAFSD